MFHTIFRACRPQFRWCVLFFSVFISSIAWSQAKPVVFTDVTRQAGIDFRYTFGDYSYQNILESSGSGVTIFDYNNDGLYDLYLLNGTYIEGVSDKNGKIFAGSHNSLYKNNGNGSFTEVSAMAGLVDKNWGMAAGAADYDNDGDVDLFVLNYGPNVFYRNNGNGTFTDIASAIGLQGPEKLNGFIKWSIGVAFWDYNCDGLLDAMVGNFLAFDPAYISPTTPGMMPHPSEYKGQASLLYEQQPNGQFIDVTKKNKLYFPDSKCMGLTVFDYDNDGDLDLLQVNDHQMNFMFRNDNGKYTEVGMACGVAANSLGHATGSMHGSIGDIDGDGLTDLLVTDLEFGALYRNLGKGIFADVTETAGISGNFAGKGQWGAALFDFDNDGDPDIITANGTAEELILQYPLLLENNGKGNFKNIGFSCSEYFSTKRSGRALAIWDFDNDGDLDVIVSHVDLMATPTLLRNEGGNNNNWLALLLKGKNGPTTAISAKVVVQTPGSKQVLINQCATSYLSYNDPRLHIGLGKNNIVEQLDLIWNDGQKETYRNLKVNQYITIIQGTGIVQNNRGK